MTAPSLRWYWCIGCGRWHDPRRDNNPHWSMYRPLREPNEHNFEGSAEDLARFIAARQLVAEDGAAFEERVTTRLTVHPSTHLPSTHESDNL